MFHLDTEDHEFQSSPPVNVLQLFKAGQVHTGFRQTEGNSQSRGDVWHAFIQGWGHPCHRKPCVTPRVSPRVPHPCGKFWLPYILINVHKTGKMPKYYITNLIIEVMEILLILVAWTSMWGSLTDSIFPTGMLRCVSLCWGNIDHTCQAYSRVLFYLFQCQGDLLLLHPQFFWGHSFAVGGLGTLKQGNKEKEESSNSCIQNRILSLQQ